MSVFVLSFVVTFIYIFLKASQQINVVKGRYLWIMPTSIGMGLCEVSIVLLVVRADTLMMGLATGVAGGLGCMLAMRFHFGGK
jgi:hypothetical protein